MLIEVVAGTYPSNTISFSVSGIPESEQLTVLLDGNDLGWRAQEGVGTDRYFYEFRTTENTFGESDELNGSGLSVGEHELKFVLNYPASNDSGSGPQLCSVEVLEYGKANECVSRLLTPFAVKLFLDSTLRQAIMGFFRRMPRFLRKFRLEC
jgi:hypothetical protein